MHLPVIGMASIRFRSTLSFESVSGVEIHPGEVLSGILEDEKLLQADLSRAIGTPRKTISEICTAKRGISAEMASGILSGVAIRS